uniref:Uncharacterized protein n=1 Tax=viral metagenome TaxID=1070528 RepID=A0A6M3LS56_9ZZZZ
MTLAVGQQSKHRKTAERKCKNNHVQIRPYGALSRPMDFDNSQMDLRSRALAEKLKAERPQREMFFVEAIKSGLKNQEIMKLYYNSKLTYQSQFSVNVWIRYYRWKIKIGEL